MTSMRSLTMTLVSASAVLLSGSALAQAPAPPAGGEDLAEAERLFYEGERLSQAGDIEAACDAYIRSWDLSPRGAALFNVAKCNVRRGKLATAAPQLHQVMDLARQAGREKAAAEAEGMIREIEPRIPRVRVQVPPQTAAIPGVEILLDGKPVSPTLLGVGAPLDPGHHTVSARAPGHDPYAFELDIQNGEMKDGPAMVLRRTVAPAPTTVFCSDNWESGDPIPPGCTVETKLHLGLTIGGAATLGAGWIVSIAAATVATEAVRADGNFNNDEDFIPLYFPLAGPFITIATADASAAGAVVLIIDGAVQAAGAAMLLAGLLLDVEYLEYAGNAQVTPWVSPQGSGLQLSGQF